MTASVIAEVTHTDSEIVYRRVTPATGSGTPTYVTNIRRGHSDNFGPVATTTDANGDVRIAHRSPNTEYQLYETVSFTTDVNGTVAQTATADTISAFGTHPAVGTLARTNANDICVAASACRGTVATTNAPDTLTSVESIVEFESVSPASPTWVAVATDDITVVIPSTLHGLMMVAIGWTDNTSHTITGVRLDPSGSNTALTQVPGAAKTTASANLNSSYGGIDYYYLKLPGITPGTYTVRISANGGTPVTVATAQIFQFVNQTTPIGTVVSARGVGVSPSSGAIASSTDNLLVGACIGHMVGSTADLASNDTQDMATRETFGFNEAGLNVSHAQGSASHAMTWRDTSAAFGWACCAIELVADATEFAPLKSPMGINLALITYSGTEIMYADVFKFGGGYGVYSGGGSVHLDSEGWVAFLEPGQVVQVGVLLGANGWYPTGTYKATWEGTGTIIWYQDVASYTSTGSHSADVVINTTTNEGIRYRITSSSGSDPIRKIALFLPGTTPNTPVVTVNPATACQFNPAFLSSIANYGVIRSMNSFRTNDWPAFVGGLSDTTHPYPSEVWADRLNKQSRAMIGIPSTERMPYEDFIELCNQVNAHPWLNVPVSADTTWQTEFANMVLANLYPTLRVYVENSNETWNPSFQAFYRRYYEGQARTPAVGSAEVSAEYARQTILLFKSIFGDDRVTGMFAWQSLGIPGLQAALDHNIALYGSHGFDAGATALYWLEDVLTTDLTHYNSQTQADAITELYAAMHSHAHTLGGMSVPDTQAIYQQWKDALTTYDIDVLLGYENGNSMRNLDEPPNVQMNATLDAFSRDARIKPLTIDYLDSWRNAGGEVNCYFDDCSTYSKFGRWGSREQLGLARVDTPLYDGIQTWIEDNSMDLVADVIEERAHGGTIARLQVSTAGRFGTGPRTRIWQRKQILPSVVDWADQTDEDGISIRSDSMTLSGKYAWRTQLTDHIGDIAYSNEVTIILEAAEIVPPTTGLIAHWKKGTGLTSGGVGTGVSAWVDAIGSKSLAQATSGSRPLLQSDNSILFDGSDDYLQVALPALPSPATFAIVGKQVTWTGGDALCDAGTADQSFLMTQHTITPRVDFYAGGTTPSLWTDDWVIGQEDILILTANGASSNMRVSDGAVTVCTAGSPGTQSGSGLTIGAEYNTAGSPNKFSNIQIKDILIYNAVLSAPDMAQLIRFGLLE